MQHLILLHGAIGAKDQLTPLAQLLDKNFTVHTLNFSGHGGSPLDDEPFSIARFAGDLQNYLQQNKLEQVNVFGYSMGGYAAMYLCKNNPGLINRLVTLATKWQWSEEIAIKESAMLNADKIETKVPAFAAQLKDRHAPTDWKNILFKTAGMLLEMGKQPPLEMEDLKKIATPTLLLLGDNDKMVTLEETDAVSKQLPHSKSVRLNNTAHPLEQTNIEALAEEIRSWCK